MKCMNSLIKSIVTELSKSLFYKLMFIGSKISLHFSQLKKINMFSLESTYNSFLLLPLHHPVFNLNRLPLGFQDITLASASVVQDPPKIIEDFSYASLKLFIMLLIAKHTWLPAQPGN